MTKSAAELTTQEEPNWEKIAGRLLYYTFSRELKKTEENYGLTSFYEKLRYLTSEGLYGKYILDSYSKKRNRRGI